MVADNETRRSALGLREDDHVVGPESAPVTLLEYADFQCPYCATAEPVIQSLRERFSDTMRFVFREYPLVESHPDALLAARAAEAAGAQGKFWEMHDWLFENRRGLQEGRIVDAAKTMGLDAERFRRDIETGAQDNKIERDMESGDEVEVPGTPTFFINGTKYFGPPSFEELAHEIEQSSR